MNARIQKELLSLSMGLFIKKDRSKGRGVYTNSSLQKGDQVEECELLLLPLVNVPREIEGHVFEFTQKTAAIALGNGSLYNHSDNPNCSFSVNHHRKKIIFKTLRRIKKGEELTIDYGYNEDFKKRFGLS